MNTQTPEPRPDPCGLAERLCRFLSPYLLPTAETTSCDLEVRLAPPEAFLASWKACCTQPATIRETYAEGFTLKVKQGWLDDGRLVAWDEDKQVGYLIDRNRRHVDFHGGAGAFIHLIELVRYHGLLVEQAKGTAILHSSATLNEDTGGAIAIAGMKGAGKTTTMLERVVNGRQRYFSGDKLLLDVIDGRVRARGWPDFPHIGLGTLRQFPSLIKALGDDLRSLVDSDMPDQKKILLQPETFAGLIGRSPVGTAWLDEIVLPQVQLDEPLRTHRLTRTDIQRILSERSIFEWPHTFITSTWHGLPPAGQGLSAHLSPDLVEALCEVPWTRAQGRAQQQATAQA
ncbi:hypothetical protein DZC73_25160 [Albitalea terrae]|uniref:HprK-related kinase B n=1 Tax=Piscinibacter terrae TaxID=2496871 RepID=A0A3N7JKZ6_9BURK|nr:hypothetical protein DZC73_25160 [Albitalea terrae]